MKINFKHLLYLSKEGCENYNKKECKGYDKNNFKYLIHISKIGCLSTWFCKKCKMKKTCDFLSKKKISSQLKLLVKEKIKEVIERTKFTDGEN